jgi:regulator of sigma E protease
VEGPRYSQFIPILQEHEGEAIDALIIRDGEIIEVTLKVDGDGRLGILRDLALDAPWTAAPIEEFVRQRSEVSDQNSDGEDQSLETYASPVAGKEIYPGSRIISVNGIEVSNWREIREAFKQVTGGMELQLRASQLITLDLELPQPTHPRVTAEFELSADEIAALHALSWRTDLDNAYFESIQVVLSSGGNPLRAIQMGFEETWTFVLHTYLTIDRLIRGTVGVEQLRGPVGIVHLGATIADRGFMYIIFFLAMISVNLAVINFLPLPIVDGGLFLFLIYEKLKGRPPSLAFQNAATIAGLVLIVGRS